MKSTFTLILLIFIQFHLNSQNTPKWINITGNSGVEYAHFAGDSIWVGFDGGLSWIDKDSGSLRHNLNSGNSNLKGNQIKELVVNEEGEAWFLGHESIDIGLSDEFQNLQYFNGLDFADPADNIEVLDTNSSHYDLILINDDELIFREERDKIWKLCNQELVEIPTPNGYLMNRLMSDKQGVIFAEFKDAETILIGTYEENEWTIFDLQDYVSEEIRGSGFVVHNETGPDGLFYLSFCTGSGNCFLYRYKNQAWENLMIINSTSEFFWSPDNTLYSLNTTWNELREIKDWAFTGEEIRLRFPAEQFLKWDQDSTLWFIGESKLIKGRLFLNVSNEIDSDNGEVIHVGNSFFNTNEFNSVGVNSNHLKFITTEEDELYTFNGTTWELISFDDFNEEYEPSKFEFITNKNGHTFLYNSGPILIHNGDEFKEYDLPFPWATQHSLDIYGNLLVNAHGYDNLVTLNGQGEVNETTIIDPDEIGSRFVIDQNKKLWFYCKNCFPDYPQFYDGEWANIFPPPGTFWDDTSDHYPFIDSDDNVYFLDTKNQLLKYNQNLQEWEIIKIPHEDFLHPRFTVIKEDNKGNIWISSSRIGLFKFDGNSWVFFNHINAGLSSVAINDMTIDDNDNIWIATNSGLSIFNEEGIVSLGTSESKRLEGLVYFDLDSNGEFTFGEDIVAENIPLYIHPYENLLFTNNNGVFGANVLPGNYTVELLPIEHWKVEGEKQVSISNEDLLDLNFGLIADTIFDEAKIYITGNPSRCDELIDYFFFVENTGTTLLDLRVNIVTDENVESFTSTIPLTFDSTHFYHYDYMQLKPNESLKFKLNFKVPNYMFLGDTLKWRANVQFLKNGNYVEIDSTHFDQEVLCSYDPNDKLTQTTGKSLGAESLVEDELLYTIRFQNTGNDVAFRVEIIDTLDNEIDISTFNVIQNSHPMETYIEEGRIVHFVFDDINLPDSTSNEIESHGFIQYTVSANQSLMLPIEITNTAHIYFDNNPAIVTNTTQNTLVECLPFNESSTNIILNEGESYFLPDGTEVTETGNYVTDILDNEGCIIEKIYTNLEVLTSVDSLPLDGQIEIFPNPNNGVFNINLKGSFPSILQMSLINITGQEVYAQQIEFEDNILEFEELPNGLYTIKFVDKVEKVQAIKKVVIQK